MSEEDRAWGLIERGRPGEALLLTERLVAAPSPSATELAAHAVALKGVGRIAEALPFQRRSVELAPGDEIGWYNLAATACDLGLGEEAEAAARRSIGMGFAAPEARRTLGCALMLQQRLDEAEAWFRQALALRPAYPDALKDLMDVIWMNTADLAKALEPADAAIAAAPRMSVLYQLRALVQQFAGDQEGSAATLERGLSAAPGDPLLLLAASRLATERGMGVAAVDFARQAQDRARGAPIARRLLAFALLADGNPAEAAQITEDLLRRDPADQTALALQATAWRILDDDRRHALYDYAAFVRPCIIGTPDGWPNLEAYLADLRQSLRALHKARTHPIRQSLRHGTQVSSLASSSDPAIAAFFGEARKAIARYQSGIGAGTDPLRSRNTGKAVIHASWSVRLQPGGFHVSHIHPEGWLSSAFYAETPDAALGAGGREGWIKFGEPDLITEPKLEAEHYVKPEPGMLVLFPSYMWHGTVPFHSDESRMTIAFDVVPA